MLQSPLIRLLRAVLRTSYREAENLFWLGIVALPCLVLFAIFAATVPEGQRRGEV